MSSESTRREELLGSRRALPALAMPKGKENGRAAAVLSVLAHILVIALLVTPIAAVHHDIVQREQGAGGTGPAGGGGGGRGGSGGEPRDVRERLRYIVVTPKPVPTPTTIPEPQPQVVPPVIPPPKPVEPKPEPPKQQPEVKPIEVPAKSALEVSLVSGTGGGSGRDGSMGSGLGSGGGVGSGIGTGRGSGVGSGTGGGTQENYPPSPVEMFIPPMPVPDKVKGFHLIAEFDVDEAGRVVSFDFTPTRDGEYNRKLRDVFRSYRFRPGTRPDGTPLRMKAQVAVDIF